jgi:hypothetical protein
MPATRTAPGVDELVWSKNASEGLPWWRAEAEKRWPGNRIVMFACHGGPDPAGVWYAVPDAPVEVLAQTLHDLYPDAIVVLICCNRGGSSLDVPGIAYAKQIVWIEPFSQVGFHVPWGAGSIDQFTCR